MSDTGQLFEWELPAKPVKEVEAPELVPRPPGWYLVATNRSGPIGFHVTSIPDLEYAANHSVRTLCGITGRRMGVFPDEIVLCQQCVTEQRKKRR